MSSHVCAQGRAPVVVFPPSWAVERLRNAGVAIGPVPNAKYELSEHLNPFYLQGDFDGDGRTDIALLVRRRSDRKVGIAILFRRSPRLTLLGAGTPFGNGGDDFRWMDVWEVLAKEDAPNVPNLWNDPVPRFKRDALYVEKTESAGGLIYYDGTRFRWFQMGD